MQQARFLKVRYNSVFIALLKVYIFPKRYEIHEWTENTVKVKWQTESDENLPLMLVQSSEKWKPLVMLNALVKKFYIINKWANELFP